MAEPASDAPDPLEAVEQAIAICGGDVRAALRAALVANSFLADEVERLTRAASFGFARSESQREAGPLARNLGWRRGRNLTSCRAGRKRSPKPCSSTSASASSSESARARARQPIRRSTWWRAQPSRPLGVITAPDDE